jgi:uncharacterized membrane protein YdjX (TVP38/TMEM64 family)
MLISDFSIDRPSPRYIARMPRPLREYLSTAVKLAGMVVPILLGIGLGRLASPYLPQFTAWVNTLGPWAPLAFVVAYMAAAVLMLPAFLLTMAGGAVFGIVNGALLVLLGATLGGVCAFLLGRTILRDWVAKQVAKNATLAVVDRVIGQDGLRLMMLIRLSGAVPFVLTNYALGVTTVRLRDFTIAMLGMTPTILAFATFGQAGVQSATGEATMPTWVLALGIGATVLLAVLLTRIAQRAIREAEARQAMVELGPNTLGD